ncbi:hypothetical protein FF36_01625 [Frankia torreyi]|uniref:Uncharacterized protein n=1 Tax=Frankia torreyi TaxID=1856 RepID=A0A0D8BI55_9ACTN|nr:MULTISPECIES: hypothetical protein [Frankia]KJE23938.1 hypothetical protein FF36_01625 [Frankia torreyi]KQM07421.1 hypothetical protein FF86_1003114 [Frankia sp. CpI1-P]
MESGGEVDDLASPGRVRFALDGSRRFEDAVVLRWPRPTWQSPDGTVRGHSPVAS